MMASLYKRATPSQVRILRVVEGAVKNAADGHPELEIPAHFPRSVAKRAAGTLTAQWPDVLAARSASSDKARVSLNGGTRLGSSQYFKGRYRGAVPSAYRRSPLIDLWHEIARSLRPLKDAGQIERYEALVDVLKMIAARQAKQRCETIESAM